MSALLLFRSGSESALQFIGGARTGAPLLFLVRSAERERAPKSRERLMLCEHFVFALGPLALDGGELRFNTLQIVAIIIPLYFSKAKFL